MTLLKKSISIFILLSFLIIFHTAQASNANEQLAQLLSNYQRLSAHFSQTIVDEYGNVMQQAKGDVAIQRPDQLRWYTATPTQQLIIADSNKLWIYDIDLEQVTIENLHRLSNSAPAMLLTGSAEELQQHFTITADIKNNKQQFKLTPRGEDDLVQWIELTFEQNKIQHMRMMSQLNQITEIDFDRVELNPRLTKNLFYFKLPGGVDIIDNSDA